MSTHWENDFGDEFETEEEAREDSYEKMDRMDIDEALGMILSFSDLLDWCWNQPKFWDDFGEAICEAEDMFFRDNYHEVEDSEE